MADGVNDDPEQSPECVLIPATPSSDGSSPFGNVPDHLRGEVFQYLDSKDYCKAVMETCQRFTAPARNVCCKQSEMRNYMALLNMYGRPDSGTREDDSLARVGLWTRRSRPLGHACGPSPPGTP